MGLPLTNELQHLSKVEDLNRQFKKVGGDKIKPERLKENLIKFEQRYLEHKDKQSELSRQSFTELYAQVSQFVNGYKERAQGLESINLADFEFLEDDKKIQEIVTQMEEEGDLMSESNELAQLILDIQNAKELQTRDPKSKTVSNLINRKQQHLDEMVEKDRQLAAERRLRESKIIGEGKKTGRVKEKAEELEKLMNADSLLERAKGQYDILKQFIAMKDRVDKLDENFSALHDEIHEPQSNDIGESSGYDPAKRKEIVEKISASKERRKTKGELEVAREVVKAQGTRLEKSLDQLTRNRDSTSVIKYSAQMIRSLIPNGKSMTNAEVNMIMSSADFQKNFKKGFELSRQAKWKENNPIRARLQEKLAARQAKREVTPPIENATPSTKYDKVNVQAQNSAAAQPSIT